MESRKYLLQQQIIEALKANDDDLYSLLKSQWAHRFGVESLEELKSLDLNDLNRGFSILPSFPRQNDVPIEILGENINHYHLPLELLQFVFVADTFENPRFF